MATDHSNDFDRPLQPTAIDHHGQPGRLRIRWSDGHLTDVRTNRLRALCPCATCNELRAERQRNPLAMAQSGTRGGSDLVKITWVGNYGLMPVWGDGHDTGIFTYHFLRRLENDP